MSAQVVPSLYGYSTHACFRSSSSYMARFSPEPINKPRALPTVHRISRKSNWKAQCVHIRTPSRSPRRPPTPNIYSTPFYARRTLPDVGLLHLQYRC